MSAEQLIRRNFSRASESYDDWRDRQADAVHAALGRAADRLEDEMKASLCGPMGRPENSRAER